MKRKERLLFIKHPHSATSPTTHLYFHILCITFHYFLFQTLYPFFSCMINTTLNSLQISQFKMLYFSTFEYFLKKKNTSSISKSRFFCFVASNKPSQLLSNFDTVVSTTDLSFGIGVSAGGANSY